MKILWTALTLAALVASCQAPRFLVVEAPLAELKPLVAAAQKAGQIPSGWTLADGPSFAPGGPVVATLTTRGSVASSGAALVRLPAALTDAVPFPVPSALARLGRDAQGERIAIPLFFDLWGQSRAAAPPAGQVVDLDWTKLVTASGPKTLVAAGTRPAFRQWAYLAEDPALASPTPQALAGLVNRPSWVPSVWNLTRADLEPAYGPAPQALVVETFRDFEGRRGGPNRTYFPVTLGSGSTLTVGGLVVELVVSGPGSADDLAPLVKALVGLGFQGAVQTQTHWLAANLNTPDLDGVGSAARGLTNQAFRFLVTTDAVDPQGQDFNAVLQRTFDATPRR